MTSIPVQHGRRFVDFVISSDSLSGADLLDRLGPAGASGETVDDSVGRPGVPRTFDVGTWAISSALDPTASVEAHLVALHGRARAAADRIVSSGDAHVVTGLLRIVQYLPSSECQGHGFVLEPAWISLLAEVNGVLDVDQYVVDDQDT